MERLKLAVAAATALMVGACVAPQTVHAVRLPDGTEGWNITCNGRRSDVSDCMNQAAETCQGRYTILNSGESETGATALPVYGGGVVSGRHVHRNLIVSCQH